jgi:hypothetical protein
MSEYEDKTKHGGTSPQVPPTPGASGNGGNGPPANTAQPAADPPPDPFDPANLRLSQNFLSSGAVKRHLTTVPVRKPTREEFVRIRPEAEYTLDTLVLELKDSREIYVIAPALPDELATEPTVSPRRLHTAISRQGTLFLWPAKLPPSDGRADRWSESMLEIVEAAKTDWIRVQSDMGVGAYVYSTPVATLPPPDWPTIALPEILRLAFKHNYIDTLDHPVLRRLRGEV